MLLSVPSRTPRALPHFQAAPAMCPLIFQGPKGKQGKAGAPGRRGIQVSDQQLVPSSLPASLPVRITPLPEALINFFYVPRAYKGCQGLGAWWGDRAPRVSRAQMGFLAGMVKQDSR